MSNTKGKIAVGFEIPATLKNEVEHPKALWQDLSAFFSDLAKLAIAVLPDADEDERIKMYEQIKANHPVGFALLTEIP